MDKTYIETLGCPKNWVESEHLLGQLDNVSMTSNPEEAKTIIVNTCSFLEESRKESIETILQLAQYKTKGQCNKLIVSGCLVESHASELENELYEVDLFHTATQNSKLIDYFNSKDGLANKNRYYLQTQGSNYLKISDGCNHKCSFCTIPQFKGRLKSRLKEDLVRETEDMVNRGIYEINLVAQDLSSYGVDLENENLSSLLRALVRVKKIKWIRLLYLYPTMISDELIHLVKEEEKIVRYFDIPFQHLDNKVLKAMGRFGTVEEYWDLVQKIREKIDDVAIRTTLIVGFPGETEEMFINMLKWVKKFHFNHLGVFQYSPEENTKSYFLENHVTSIAKKSRFKKIMKLQQEISSQLLKEKIGYTYDTFIEEIVQGDKDNPPYYLGRTEQQAPEVDGNCVISSSEPLQIGKWFPVRIIKSSQYDLYGVHQKEKQLTHPF